MRKQMLILGVVTLSVLLSATQQKPSLPQSEKQSAPKLDRPITIFLLRHAETQQGKEKRNPNLSKEGKARAAALDRLLSKSRVTHLFASEYKRTSQTLKAVAKRHDHNVTIISARKPKNQIKALRDLPGGSLAIVAGHSNTVPQLCAALAGDAFPGNEPAKIHHDSHQRLFMITLPARAAVKKQAPQCLELQLGQH